MNTVLCQAIRERRIVRFYYDGGTRDVEPHCHGCSKDENDLLRGYQTSGHSTSSESVGWKMFRLDRVSDLTLTTARFAAPRPDYDPLDNRMATIYCCL